MRICELENFHETEESCLYFYTATGLAAVFALVSAFISGFTYLHYLLVSVTPTVASMILLMSSGERVNVDLKETEVNRDFERYMINAKIQENDF